MLLLGCIFYFYMLMLVLVVVMALALALPPPAALNVLHTITTHTFWQTRLATGAGAPVL